MNLQPIHSKRFGGLLALICLLTAHLDAVERLTASDGELGDYFGGALSLDGSSLLVGARNDDHAGFDYAGSAYLFRDIDTNPNPSITENIKLTASDPAQGNGFGADVGLLGNRALVGAHSDNNGSIRFAGSAYLYRNLDTATGTVTEDAKLTASNPDQNDYFGFNLGLSSNIALVAAYGDNHVGKTNAGTGYLFRNLDTVTGTVTEDAMLTASDAATENYFGKSISLVGDTALIGADGADHGGFTFAGAAYLFRNLDAAAQGSTVTENVKLTASDAAENDRFGHASSLSGSSALVGARFNSPGGITKAGSSYLYRDLDTATGTVTENAKLTASDAEADDWFGQSNSLDGDSALVGAPRDDHGNLVNAGSVYLFHDLDSATGVVTENVKITNSDATANSQFGYSVILKGNRFFIGTYSKETVYTGEIDALIKVDGGGDNKVIKGFSFESREDWIVGENTDNNKLTLSAGDSADVTSTGKAVYVGKNAGSDGNALIIEGALIAKDVFIGSVDGNTGNTLQFDAGSTFDLSDIYIADENILKIEGNYIDPTTLFGLLDDTNLRVEEKTGGTYTLATVDNYQIKWKSIFDGTYTYVMVPEPSTYALLLGLLLSGFAAYKKRKA